MVTASNSPDACLSFKVSRHDETFATLKHPMIDIVASGNTALALATTFDVNQQRVNTCRRNVNVKRTSLAVGPSTWMRMRSISLLFSFPFFFPPPPRFLSNPHLFGAGNVWCQWIVGVLVVKLQVLNRHGHLLQRVYLPRGVENVRSIPARS